MPFSMINLFFNCQALNIIENILPGVEINILIEPLWNFVGRWGQSMSFILTASDTPVTQWQTIEKQY